MDLIVVEKEEEGKRLDKLLQERFQNFSRTYFQGLIEKQLVLVNGEIVKKREQCSLGDEIEIEFVLSDEIALEPENIPLDILYEDDEIIAVNKPPTMVVHPGAGNPSHTFVNALLYHCKQLPHLDTLRPGIVHRLDKETSGVLIAAKTTLAHQKLVALFATRKMHKEYVAITSGHTRSCLVDAPIARHPIKRQEMAIVENGKPARTHVEALKFDGQFSYVRLLPETGRTHQLRVHLKSIGTPVLGDKVYGNKKPSVERQLLHAHKLQFTHPIFGQEMELIAPIPEDIKAYLT